MGTSTGLPVFCKNSPPGWLEDLLVAANIGHGSDASIECVCGRTHATTEDAVVHHDGLGELERLRELEKACPGSVIFREIETVHAWPLNWPGAESDEYVIGCPCNALMLFGRLVMDNIKFVTLLARDMADKAQARALQREQLAAATKAAAVAVDQAAG